MLIEFSKLDSFYEDVCRRAKPSPLTTSILIVPSNDPDSLCATKILTVLMKQDCLSHEIKPATSYADIKAISQNYIIDNENLKSIILVNCGGLVDLQEYLSLRDDDDIKIFLIDSHRPINLANIYGGSDSQQICILDDGDFSSALMQPVSEAFKLLTDAEGLEIESDDDDEEEDEGSDGEENEEVSEKIKPEDDTNLEKENADDVETVNRKRKLDQPVEKESYLSIKRRRNAKMQILMEKQDIIKSYYKDGNFFGMSASGLLYTMASQLNRCNNDMLWLAIMGLTEQFVNDKISFVKYESQLKVFNDEVAKFNLPIEDQFQNPDLENNPNEDLTGPSIGLNGVRSANDQTISKEDEFRLMLLRHWNLMDSMYHSTYVACKLGLWREKGRSKLFNMIAKMGFPQKECLKSYTAMNLDYKRILNSKLKQLAPTFNMHEIIFPSFIRRFGYKQCFSSSDAVFSLSSILDFGSEWFQRYASGDIPTDIAMNRTSLNAATSRLGGMLKGGAKRIDDGVDGRGFGQQQGVGVETKTGIAAVGMRIADLTDSLITDFDCKEGDDEDSELDHWVKNFWIAYDALDNIDLMTYGVHLSMQFQSTLVETGVSILEQSLVKTQNTFRFVVLANQTGSTANWKKPNENNNTGGSTSNSSSKSGGASVSIDKEFGIFGKSINHLSRLATFLLEALKTCNQQNLPLVIAAMNEERDSYLVIGRVALTRSGQVKKNAFGIAFQATAEKTGAHVKHDTFDTCVIEVKKDELSTFLGQLKTLI